MLTVRKVGMVMGKPQAAAAVARYVLDVAESPQAFARPGEGEAGPPVQGANTMWLGSQSTLDLLGLTRGAVVTEEQLALALQGRHAVDPDVRVRWPGTRQVRDRHNQPKLDEFHKPCLEGVVNNFNLVLSAPKSVSVIWAVADAQLRAQIEEAMMEAANAMLTHMTMTQLVVGGNEVAQGFAASAALHVTARTAEGERVPSPQLHMDCHLVGVKDSEGKLRTPNAGAVFKNSAPRQGGAVGRAVLAERMRQLGFRIEHGTGRGGRYFEIAGVARDLCKAMSGRTFRDVNPYIAKQRAEKGRDLTSREEAMAAVLTRTDKDRNRSPQEIQEEWAAIFEEFEFGRARLEQIRGEPVPQRSLDELFAEARATILQRMWEDGPTVSIGAAEAMALELLPMGLSPAQAGRVLEAMLADGTLVALDKGQVTSREIREREQYVMKVALEAPERGAAPLSKRARKAGEEAAARSLGPDKPLLDDQREAIRKLTGGAAFAALTGQAGAGKGPVLQAVAEAHRRAGWRVIGCALDGATKERVGHQMEAHAKTIEMLLYAVRERTVRIDGRTLILIDEASKIGLRHWVVLARIQAMTRARVILVGDPGQMGAIECPGMFEAILKTMPDAARAVLTEVLRHRDPRNPKDDLHPWLIQYLDELYTRDAKAAIDRLRSEGAITMHKTRADALESLVTKWAERRREWKLAARETILIVHGSNDDIDAVNKLAQATRRDDDELGREGVKAVDRDYWLYENDVVMLREAAYRLDTEPRVENGTIGVVVAVDVERESVRVAFEQPGGGTREVWIDLGKLRAQREANGLAAMLEGQEAEPVASLRLAYAGHPFPLQGGTWKYVGSLWGHWTQRLEATYVDNSRAAWILDVHADEESLAREGRNEDPWDSLVKLVKTSDNKLASIEYDEVHAEVRVRFATPEPIPAKRPEAPAHDRSDERRAPEHDEAELELDGIRVDDPLEAHRAVLGTSLDSIRRLTDSFTGETNDLDERALRGRRDQGRKSIDGLRRLAAALASIERDQPALTERIAREEALASELKAEADRRRGLRKRNEREDLLRKADRHRTRAAEYEAALEGLVDKELTLRRRVDEWLADEGERFARGMAAERRLAVIHEVRVHEETQRALAAPRAYILDAIGPRPEHESDREEWAALTHQLVRERVTREAREAEGLRPSARDTQLQRRIDQFREQQELGRQDAPVRASDGPGLDF